MCPVFGTPNYFSTNGQLFLKLCFSITPLLKLLIPLHLVTPPRRYCELRINTSITYCGRNTFWTVKMLADGPTLCTCGDNGDRRWNIIPPYKWLAPSLLFEHFIGQTCLRQLWCMVLKICIVKYLNLRKICSNCETTENTFYVLRSNLVFGNAGLYFYEIKVWCVLGMLFVPPQRFKINN
jgi:hypothetical protein